MIPWPGREPQGILALGRLKSPFRGEKFRKSRLTETPNRGISESAHIHL